MHRDAVAVAVAPAGRECSTRSIGELANFDRRKNDVWQPKLGKRSSPESEPSAQYARWMLSEWSGAANRKWWLDAAYRTGAVNAWQ